MAFKLWHVPIRLAAGAYILNSGLSKRQADEETAKGLHGFASTAYPEIEDTPPDKFVTMLSTGEIAVGAMLLTPVVPTAVAGLALTTFAGMMGRLYLNAPGVREEGSIKPTEQGIPLAKDVWMLGMGTALTIDGLGDRRRKRSSKKAKAAKKAKPAKTAKLAKTAKKAKKAKPVKTAKLARKANKLRKAKGSS